MFPQRRKDSTFLSYKDGKIIEMDESTRESLKDIQTKEDERIKQQKYQKEIEKEPNEAKKMVKKHSGLILKVGILLILVPITIFLIFSIWKMLQDSNQNIQTQIETTQSVETQTEQEVQVQQTPAESVEVQEMISSVDGYNGSILNGYQQTKDIANNVVYSYGDTLTAQGEMETLYYQIMDQYESFQQDSNLQDEIPTLYEYLDKRFQTLLTLTQNLAMKIDTTSIERDINQAISNNNAYLEQQVQAETSYLQGNNIAYEQNGLTITIKGTT